MGRDNVFLYDVEVPEVVREKLDAAFLIIKKERENTMKKEQTIEKRTENTEENRKSKRRAENKKAGQRKFAALAVTAAACIIVVTGVAIAQKGGQLKISNETGILSNNSSNDISANIESGGHYEDDTMSTVEETFTLTILGAELEKDKPVQLVSDSSLITEKYAGSWAIEEMENGGVSYCINVPFTCQGNNIKSVTYSINNGAFQIVQLVGGSILVDGQPYEGELNTASIGGYDEEDTGENGEGACQFETVFYQSFTLDYQKQSDENTWINICNERPDGGELKNLILNNTLENTNLGIQKMLDNTIITCTVNYTNGTSKAADVLVNSCIMTCAEAGAEIKEDPNREEIFLTFELQ